MPQRLGLRAWLEQQIESGNYKGLRWSDKGKGQFVVPWKHASRHGWHENEDAALFKAWAVYTKRFQEERGDKPSPKTWKANFRCAVNALPDIKSVKTQSTKKGKHAQRVFEFSRKRKSRETVCQRQVPVKMPEMKPEISKVPKVERDDGNYKYNTRNKRLKVESEIKTEPYEAYSPPACLNLTSSHQSFQQQQQQKESEKLKHLSTSSSSSSTIKQEHNASKDIKTEQDDHCYQQQSMDPSNFRMCFRDIINMNDISVLPHSRELSQSNYYQNQIYPNFQYSDYNKQPPVNTYDRFTNRTVNNCSDLPDIKTVLEAAQMLLNDTNCDNLSYDMCEDLQGSDGEDIMETCRPGSVGSSLSDAELEEILMVPKEEIIDNEYENAYGQANHLNYISSCTDPFFGGKESMNKNEAFQNIQIHAITQALINSSEFC